MRRLLALALVLFGLLAVPAGLLAQPTGGPGGPAGPGGPGGPGGPAGGPAAGDAPAKITHDEEVWYRVWFRKDPIGHMHYTLDNVAEKGAQPRYKIFTEWQITPVKGLPYSYSGRSNTTVNEKWEFVESEGGTFWKKDGEDLEVRVSAKILDGTLLTNGPKGPQQYDQFKESDFGVNAMLGKFLLAKGLAAGKTHVFKLLHGLPTNPPYDEVTLQVKEKGQLKSDEAGTVEGWVCTMVLPPAYGAATGEPTNWNLFVDNEGKVLRYTTGEMDFVLADETVKDNPPLPFAARGRRDPFRNPMVVKPKEAASQATTAAAGTGTATKVVTLTKDEQAQFLQQAQDYLAKMERDNGDASLPREMRLTLLRESYDKLGALHGMVKEKEKKDLKFLDKLDKVTKRAQELYSGVERIAADMQRLREEAQIDFEENRYSALGEKFGQAQTFVGNAAIKDTRYEKEILQNFSAIRELRDRGKKRESFAARKLEIVGIIYHLVPEPIALHVGVELFGRRAEGEYRAEILRSHSSALVKIGTGAEPQLLGEGEAVDTETMVQRIERGSVHFNFQGELIRRDLGRE